MSNFSAEIKAVLDTTKIPAQIENIGKNNTITLKKFALDTSNLLNQIQTSLDGHKFKINLGDIKINNVDSQMKNAGNSAGKVFSQSLVNQINSKLSNGGIESSIAKVSAQYEKLGTTGHTKLSLIKSDIETLKQLQREMSSAKDNATLISNYEKFNNTLAKVKNNLSIVSAENKTFVSALQVSTLDNKIVTWMEKNTKAARAYGEQLDSLRSRLAGLNAADDSTFASEFDAINKEFNQIRQSAISAGEVGSTFINRFKGAFSSILNYVSVSTVIYQSINALKQMYQNVYNIDTQMTELKKVTNETADAYDRFLTNAGTTAKEIGTTVSDLVNSTADFARLGYSFTDSQELAKVANIYAVVGDEIEGIDEATNSLISTMTAYNVDSDNAMSIIDKFNEVGNTQAISSGGIGDALQRSASSLAAANNTLDQSIALITAAEKYLAGYVVIHNMNIFNCWEILIILYHNTWETTV